MVALVVKHFILRTDTGCLDIWPPAITFPYLSKNGRCSWIAKEIDLGPNLALFELNQLLRSYVGLILAPPVDGIYSMTDQGSTVWSRLCIPKKCPKLETFGVHAEEERQPFFSHLFKKYAEHSLGENAIHLGASFNSLLQPPFSLNLSLGWLKSSLTEIVAKGWK